MNIDNLHLEGEGKGEGVYGEYTYWCMLLYKKKASISQGSFFYVLFIFN